MSVHRNNIFTSRGFVYSTLWCVFFATLEGCTYRVNSLVDAPDSNPGDFRCAREIPDNAITTGDDGGLCTLRAAIMEANAWSILQDTIEVPPGHYRLVLPASAGGGRLRITEDVRVQGAGPGVTLIDGNHQTPIFGIYGPSEPEVSISGLTIQNGRGVSASGAGIEVLEGSTLALSDCTVENNEANLMGGGIFNDGHLHISRCTIKNNRVPIGLGKTDPDAGGGQQHSGGGIMNASDGNLIVENSTISGNVSSRGGGIRNGGGDVTIKNTTISQNAARYRGGGLMNHGQAEIAFSTIAFNQARSAPPHPISQDPERGGGGLINTGEISMSSTILADNQDEELVDFSPDCRSYDSGTISSHGRNILGIRTQNCNIALDNTDIVGNLVNPLAQQANADLSPNGGITHTHLPRLEGQAVDRGAVFPPCPTIDQRGFVRPVDGNDNGNAECDSGSVERGAVPLALPISTVIASSHQSPNTPSNVVDGDLTSRWAAEGLGEHITMNLGSIRVVSSVSLAWYRGDLRRARFDVQLSTDNTHWRTILENGESSGTSLNPETYDLTDQIAQYVRIVGRGNDENNWISITDAEIQGAL